MAEQDSGGAPEGVPQDVESTEQGQQGTTLRVQQDREAKTSYANVCLLSSTREEMFLNFGLAQPSPNRERREAAMVVSDKIIMTPAAAKRLTIGLSQTIQRYENRFGTIEIGPAPAPQAAPKGEPPATS